MEEPAWTNLAGLFAVITALLMGHVQVTEGARCYVCVPRAGGSAADAHNMFPGEKTPLPKCDDFNAEDTRFMRNCPSAYEGCLTQTNGSHVTRTCGDYPVNDCKIANHIQYCYCSGNLCNREPATPLAAHPDATDDEDLAQEGSGAGGGGGGGHGNRDGTHRHRDASSATTVRLAVPITTTSSSPPAAAKSAASRTDTTAAMVASLCLALAGRRW